MVLAASAPLLAVCGPAVCGAQWPTAVAQGADGEQLRVVDVVATQSTAQVVVTGVDIGAPATEPRAPGAGARDESSRSRLLALAAAATALVGLGVVLVRHARRVGATAGAPTEIDLRTVPRPDDRPSRRRRVARAGRRAGVACGVRGTRHRPAARGRSGGHVRGGRPGRADPVGGCGVAGHGAVAARGAPPHRRRLERVRGRRVLPPGTAIDVELSPLIDAVAIHPLTADDLEVALRVAASQRADRHATLARAAAPPVAAGPPL